IGNQEGVWEVDNAMGINGTLNQGFFPIFLKPRAERGLGVNEVIAQLRPKLAQVVGIRVFMSNPPPINIGGLQSRRQYQFSLQSTDVSQLYTYAAVLEDRIRKLPGFEDVSSDLQIRNPQARVHIDRDRVAALGLTVSQVETALYNAYGTRQVSTIYAPSN